MFNKEQKQIPQNEEQDLIQKTYEFPWGLMFEDNPTQSLMARFFPYIAIALMLVTILIVAIKK